MGVLTTGSGRLAGVDVADDHDVDVKLLLTTTLVRRCSCGVMYSCLMEGEAVAGARGWTYPMVAVCFFVLNKLLAI